MNDEDADLIDEALKDPARTRFFARAAKHPQWIDSTLTKGQIRKLNALRKSVGDKLRSVTCP